MSTSRSSSVKSSHASSSLSSSSSSRPPPSSTPSSPLSSSSSSILSRLGGSSSPLSSVVLSLVSAASITAVEVNGRRRALAESCSVWLKHRMRLTSSNVFASRCSTVVCLSFEVALSPTKVKIYRHNQCATHPSRAKPDITDLICQRLTLRVAHVIPCSHPSQKSRN